MAQAAHGDEHHHGGMNIADQKSTFHGFMVATVWSCAHLAQAVALLTFGFAIGMGWWAGVAAYVLIGVGAGLVFKLGGAWWALLVAITIFLVLGGIIIPPIAGMMG